MIAGMGQDQSLPLLVKRYAGRRLYVPAMLAYVSLQDLADMVLQGKRFIVRDSATGEDITRDILDRLH